MSSTQVDHEDSRKAFEAFMQAYGGSVMLDRHPLYSHLYRVHTTNICWEVWKLGRENGQKSVEGNSTSQKGEQ